MPPARRGPDGTVEVVDPGWLLRAFLLTVAVAALFGYAVVCWIFWQGQWQLVLRPTRTVAHTPGSLGLPFQPVRFGPIADGRPALSGWWVPAPDHTTRVALLLHGGDGSMADALPAILALHAANLSVLAFDYRGYGASTGKHPTQASMQADAATALDYLAGTRGIPPAQIVPFGIGTGASLAVTLASTHPGLPALILEDAKGDYGSYIQRQNKSRLLPVGLLFTQNFPLATPLTTLTTPKLLISYTAGGPPVEFAQAATPKTMVEVPPGAAESTVAPQLRSFLDSYLR